MAHYKRHRPRSKAFGYRISRGYWLSHWPRHHDITYHTRPRRRAEAAVAAAIVRKGVDPDAAIWPLEKKPHKYYW